VTLANVRARVGWVDPDPADDWSSTNSAHGSEVFPSGCDTLYHMNTPPDGLPVYRVLTGPDDASFCERVSAALKLGYRLHLGPSITFDGDRVIVAQALIWPEAHVVDN
jgi:hypothetical protein